MINHLFIIICLYAFLYCYRFNPDEVAVIPCQEYFSSSFTRLNRKFDILKGKEPRNLNEILLNLEDMDELQIRSENFFSGHVTANCKNYSISFIAYVIVQFF